VTLDGLGPLVMFRLIVASPVDVNALLGSTSRSIATECGENGVACEAPTDFVGRHVTDGVASCTAASRKRETREHVPGGNIQLNDKFGKSIKGDNFKKKKPRG
jgi:hypothetical protein